MKNLEFIIRGKNTALRNFYVNGKKIEVKNGEKDTMLATTAVEEDSAEVVIYKTHHYTGKCWWLINILYYLFSFFGIFDIKKDKTCEVVDCRFTLFELKEQNKIYLTELEDKENYIRIDTLCQKQEFINATYIDTEALSRQKRLKGYKALTFFTILTIIILLVIFL